MDFLFAFVIVYILFGIYLYFNQRGMMYFPNNQNFEDCVGFKDFEKKEYGGTKFYFKQKAQRAIVYYHGNAGSACDRSWTRSVFEQSDYSLIFVEYAGYSGDNRKPSRDLILKDVENIQGYLVDHSFSDNIIYGHSIGASAASYHASIADVENLILVAPFSSLREFAQSMYWFYPVSLLLTEKYDNIEWLQDFQGRVLILHGESDKVIPIRFSQKLFESIPSENKEYELIPGFGHNDIWNSHLFKEKLLAFINQGED